VILFLHHDTDPTLTLDKIIDSSCTVEPLEEAMTIVILRIPVIFVCRIFQMLNVEHHNDVYVVFIEAVHHNEGFAATPIDYRHLIKESMLRRWRCPVPKSIKTRTNLSQRLGNIAISQKLSL
jgi:flavin reductase (DIM6/NTAB) family NADH-FMN oxidoreductase RutF